MLPNKDTSRGCCLREGSQVRLESRSEALWGVQLITTAYMDSPMGRLGLFKETMIRNWQRQRPSLLPGLIAHCLQEVGHEDKVQLESRHEQGVPPAQAPAMLCPSLEQATGMFQHMKPSITPAHMCLQGVQ